MNLDLILENIRLKHIETLLQEATTDLEVVRGQRLINESIMQLHGVLMEEMAVHANHPDLNKEYINQENIRQSVQNTIQNNRDLLADRLGRFRKNRDEYRLKSINSTNPNNGSANYNTEQANSFDNLARRSSTTGTSYLDDYQVNKRSPYNMDSKVLPSKINDNILSLHDSRYDQHQTHTKDGYKITDKKLRTIPRLISSAKQ